MFPEITLMEIEMIHNGINMGIIPRVMIIQSNFHTFCLQTLTSYILTLKCLYRYTSLPRYRISIREAIKKIKAPHKHITTNNVTLPS